MWSVTVQRCPTWTFFAVWGGELPASLGQLATPNRPTGTPVRLRPPCRVPIFPPTTRPLCTSTPRHAAAIMSCLPLDHRVTDPMPSWLRERLGGLTAREITVITEKNVADEVAKLRRQLRRDQSRLECLVWLNTLDGLIGHRSIVAVLPKYVEYMKLVRDVVAAASAIVPRMPDEATKARLAAGPGLQTHVPANVVNPAPCAFVEEAPCPAGCLPVSPCVILWHTASLIAHDELKSLGAKVVALCEPGAAAAAGGGVGHPRGSGAGAGSAGGGAGSAAGSRGRRHGRAGGVRRARRSGR